MGNPARKLRGGALIAALIFASVLSLLAQACVQQDTTGDTTQQEVDRENAGASALKAQYAPMEGTFVGSVSDVSGTNSSAVELVLGVGSLPPTGTGGFSFVSLPTLVGVLKIFPELPIDNGNGGLGSSGLAQSFPVSSGQYDGGSLSLTLQENGSSVPMQCTVTNLNHLDCSWYTDAGASSDEALTLDRQGAQNGHDGSGQPLLGTGIVGSYIGSDADYSKITASFRTYEKPQGPGSQPVVSIAGNFTFYSAQNTGSANFPFIDGVIDPETNTLAFSINGDNPIEVNCIIKSSKSLHCIWMGTHGATATEEFDLSETSD